MTVPVINGLAVTGISRMHNASFRLASHRLTRLIHLKLKVNGAVPSKPKRNEFLQNATTNMQHSAMLLFRGDGDGPIYTYRSLEQFTM